MSETGQKTDKPDGSAASPPGIHAVRDIPLLTLLGSAALTPAMLALWIITVPFLLVHSVAAVILSGVTQRDWQALMRSLPTKEPEAAS